MRIYLLQAEQRTFCETLGDKQLFSLYKGSLLGVGFAHFLILRFIE